MARSSEAPYLHWADKKLKRALIAVAFIPLTLAVLLIVFKAALEPLLGGSEVYKIILQFLVVTAGGGLLLAIVANARDEVSRWHARAAGVQQLIDDLDKAYRSLKSSKRRLRAFATYEQTDPPGEKIPRWIEKEAFEGIMADFLAAQLQLESISIHISRRRDVIKASRIDRMATALYYVARYYHDVHEDFERGRASLGEGRYDLRQADRIKDFMCTSSRAKDLMEPAVIDQLRKLEKQELGLVARSAALSSLVKASPEKELPPGKDGIDDGKKIERYGKVAEACLDLLTDELTEVCANLLRQPPRKTAVFSRAAPISLMVKLELGSGRDLIPAKRADSQGASEVPYHRNPISAGHGAKRNGRAPDRDMIKCLR